ncbi:hypothetical protein D7147_08435 [Micromonospora musae]|uniref:PKD domain-containing protein n=1 Tax=Micromonospora musae TaxID=1894970 RepID=A0ABX9RC25_9ACTN|nr:hypothetical protein D7147_08435 [Micromonospora musae]
MLVRHHGGRGGGTSPRRRLAAAVLATTLTLTMSLVGGQAAHAAERPSAGVVPPLGKVANGALLEEGIKGDPSALKWLNGRKGRPKEAPPSPEEARLNAKKKAVQLDQRSSWDAEQVDMSASASQALNLSSAPPEPQASECLARPDSNSVNGVTLNRDLWCQRYRLGSVLYEWDENLNVSVKVGEITMEFTAVVAGRRDDRSVRVYYKAVPGSVDYDVREIDRVIAPTMAITIGADCQDTGCSRIGQPIYKTWAQWNTDDTWWSWDITSDEAASTGPDDVLFHNWYLTYQGSGGGFVFPPDGSRTPERTIRCDSATYFKFGETTYPKACINAEVIPHLQYSINSAEHGAVAEHIRTAQNEPQNTWPITYLPKRIPGKFTGDIGDPGLHRVAPESVNYSENEKERKGACNRTGNYDGMTGMPPYNTTTHDCDEYPFRITEEGAASPDWDFSVRAVPLSQNRSAGASLNVYVVSDRILYDYDEFWVEINDGTGGGGGGGGTGPVDDAPLVDAGPDRTGDEGSAINLYGLASDDGGAPDATWSYTPGSGVDAGTSCAFGDVHSARTTFTCDDDGVFTLRLTASDGVNAAVSDTATVTVLNAPPRITSLVPPDWQVYKVGDPVSLKATFTDAANDTHTCAILWDDTTTSQFTAQGHACEQTHVFPHAGMYTIEVTVTDDDGASATAKTMVVVYNPQGGFVTSGANFASPAGALSSNPTAAERMRVQLNPQYQQGEPGPALSGGRVSATLDGGAFTLESTKLDWLVVAPDAKAAVKGEATVNGTAGYGFVAYGYDDPAKMRLVVWPLSSGPNPGTSILYDNRRGTDYDLDRADPQPLDGGSLQVHE